MATEFEKMRNEELYNFSDPEIMESITRAKKLCCKLRQMTEFDEGYRIILNELIPNLPETTTIVAPFTCDHGHGIKLGNHVFINGNCTMLDSGRITIGNNTLIGPNCSFYTPQHPFNYIERREPKETGLSITIGDDCWLGGNVTVLPGVTIGNRCIIGAGSVVTKNIPNDCVAAGNPAKVIRKNSTE